MGVCLFGDGVKRKPIKNLLILIIGSLRTEMMKIIRIAWFVQQIDKIKWTCPRE